MAENIGEGPTFLKTHGPVAAPDGRAGGPPGPPGLEPSEGERDPNEEAESLKYTRRESLSDELISGAETPQELYVGLRQLEKQLEESFIPPNLQERYTPPRQLSTMYERADMMALSVEDMQRRGIILKDGYNPTTGEAKLKDRRYAAVALKTELTEKPAGRYMQQEVKYYVGTNEERKTLEKAYRRAMVELAARDILGEHLGLRLNVETRDSLEYLVAYLHSPRTPKFKSEHLEALFNMPDVDELVNNPENRKLGDQVEEAMLLNLIMLNSGTKQRMQDFLRRPGVKFLIAKIAKENNMEVADWVTEYIGKVDQWEDDEPKDKEKGKWRDLNQTWREEAADGRRGLLTKWSNIAAWAGKIGEFNNEKEIEFIETTIGGAVGSVEAAWVAAALMRSIGAYASEGYVALNNGKSILPLGEARFISGDDTGKFWAYMFNMKEGLKGRKSGLRGMIGKIPDMAMNLFDWAQVEVDDIPRDKDGTPQKRSIWDAWLGTASGNKINLLTGEKTGEPLPEEPYHRLGSLKFKSLEREFHQTFTIMQWLMGNAERPTGVLIEALKTNFRYEEDYTLDNLKAIWKYIGIALNSTVLTKGSPHLYTNADDDAKVIDKNYFRNLMIARIHSASFTQGILNRRIELFTPGGPGQVDVPAVVIIKANIEEALKDSPPDEERLLERYIDENQKMRKLAPKGMPGFSEDISAIIDERFEPAKVNVDGTPKSRDQILKEAEQMKYVGRITGRAS